MYKYETLDSKNYSERIKMAISLLVERSIVQTSSEFWKSLGFANSSSGAYFYKRGAKVLKYRVALSIAYEYPIISAEWLITGNGPMLANSKEKSLDAGAMGDRVKDLETQVTQLKQNLVEVLEYVSSLKS